MIASSLVLLPYFFGFGSNRKEITERYPDPVSSQTEEDLPPRYRGILYNDIDVCTGCGDCKDICPAGSIAISSTIGTNRITIRISSTDDTHAVVIGRAARIVLSSVLPRLLLLLSLFA